MTEPEWMCSVSAGDMLEHWGSQYDKPPWRLRSKTPNIEPGAERKLRLFAVACYRRIEHHFRDRRSVAALDFFQRKAERKEDAREKRLGTREARLGYHEQEDQSRRGVEILESIPYAALLLYRAHVGSNPWYAAKDGYRAVEAVEREAGAPAELIHQAHCDLIREIFGNPFRQPILDPNWLTWNEATIPKLAKLIYDHRQFQDMPILADALEEAGCEDEAVLEHCRAEKPHVLGCWVLDWLLSE